MPDLVTYSASITAGGSTGLNAHGPFMVAKRISPPAGERWDIQRVRVAAIGGVYQYQSGFLNSAGADTNTGCMPMMGLWRNLISPEAEIMFVGCVPPRMTAYEPQVPVPIKPSDILIFGVQDPCFCAAGTVVPPGAQFTVIMEMDYLATDGGA